MYINREMADQNIGKAVSKRYVDSEVTTYRLIEFTGAQNGDEVAGAEWFKLLCCGSCWCGKFVGGIDLRCNNRVS